MRLDKWPEGCSVQRHAVVYDAAGLGEEVQQLFDGEVFLFFSGDVEDDVSLVHHDQAVAVGDGVAHVVRDHQRRQMILMDDLIRQFEHLGRRLGVERRRVLVEEQQLCLLYTSLPAVDW